MLVRVWRKGNICALLVGSEIGTATMEGLQKIKNRTILSVIPLLGLFPREMKMGS